MSNIIVVDVQPAYDASCGFMLKNLIRALNETADSGNIILMMNDEEQTGDTRESFEDYWRAAGASDDLMDRAQVVEKSFGFLRGWMDMGIEEDEIIAVVQAMRGRGTHDSRDLDPELLMELSPDGADLLSPLWLPYQLEPLRLFSGQTWVTCGGEMDCCLKEVELWLQSRHINVDRDDRYLY